MRTLYKTSFTCTNIHRCVQRSSLLSPSSPGSSWGGVQGGQRLSAQAGLYRGRMCGPLPAPALSRRPDLLRTEQRAPAHSHLLMPGEHVCWAQRRVQAQRYHRRAGFAEAGIRKGLDFDMKNSCCLAFFHLLVENLRRCFLCHLAFYLVRARNTSENLRIFLISPSMLL